MRRCKECGAGIPQGKSEVAWHCQILELCRYCYQARFPARQAKGPSLSQGSRRLLSYGQRRRMMRKQFEYREQELWSPEFYDEWIDYLKEWGWSE